MTLLRFSLGAICSGALLAPVLHAAALVNINTASLTELETLNGIGASKAQAIIDYRTQHGPFASIEDIQNVSGIGATTYNNIKDFITVTGGSQGTTDVSQSQAAEPSKSASTSTNAGPPAISAGIAAGQPIAGAGTLFEGKAFDAGGAPLVGARYLWNFGDGGTAEGPRAFHTYAYPGEYSVFLSVGYNFSSATARRDVEVISAAVSLAAEGDGSLTVGNLSQEELDIGRWSLAQGTSTFVIPEETFVPAGKGVRFAPGVLGFLGGMSAVLLYPNGTRAAGAAVGAGSPLRGQVVELSSPKTSPASAKKTAIAPAEPQKTPLVAAGAQVAALAGAPAPGWPYLMGLAAVVALGAVGAYYARVPIAPETQLSADEFEIE